MTAVTNSKHGGVWRWRVLPTVAVLLAIASFGPWDGAAVAGQDPAPGPVVVAMSTSDDDSVAYWTPERMAAALPADHVAPVATVATGGVADGPSTSGLVSRAHRYPPKRAPGAPRTLVDRAVAGLVGMPYDNLPDRTIGKVFFRDGRGDRVCSGVALNSQNKSVVWTAGHCVEAGASGGFHRNWVFVPAFGSCGNGCRPYGTFRATSLFVTSQWADSGDFHYDIGAAVVAPVDGRRLVQVVGGQGLATGEEDDARFHAVAYPADPPYNGRRQRMCTGAAVGRDLTLAGDGPAPLSLACDMTGGSSGGPWIVELGANGYGFVNGLNSYRYRDDPAHIYSPYFGDVAAELFERASTTPVR